MSHFKECAEVSLAFTGYMFHPATASLYRNPLYCQHCTVFANFLSIRKSDGHLKPKSVRHIFASYALKAVRNSPLVHPKLIPAPHFLQRGVSVAQGNRHTPLYQVAGRRSPLHAEAPYSAPPQHPSIGIHYIVSIVQCLPTSFRFGKVTDI